MVTVKILLINVQLILPQNSSFVSFAMVFCNILLMLLATCYSMMFERKIFSTRRQILSGVGGVMLSVKYYRAYGVLEIDDGEK